MPDRTPKEQLERFQNAPDDQFVRLLVHDLRSPLSGMLSAVSLLNSMLAKNDPTDAERLREVGQLLRRTTENMRQILDTALLHDQNRGAEP